MDDTRNLEHFHRLPSMYPRYMVTSRVRAFHVDYRLFRHPFVLAPSPLLHEADSVLRVDGQHGDDLSLESSTIHVCPPHHYHGPNQQFQLVLKLFERKLSRQQLHKSFRTASFP